MAMSSVKGLISKLMADAGLRERLAHDSEGVLREYNLTSEEEAAVLSVGTRYGFVTPSGTICAKASENWWASPVVSTSSAKASENWWAA